MKKVEYGALNSKQKESYNYQKVSGVLADYGYITYRMHDDYHGADFHAVHINGSVLKIQLKSRVTIHDKYLGKDIYITFRDQQGDWYLYPHDKVYAEITKHSKGAEFNKQRSIHYIPKWLLPSMQRYKI